jgi:hypothetical protein
MSNAPYTLENEAAQPIGPSPFARVALIFSSPSKAFSLPGLAGSWWAPYLVIVLISFGMVATVGKTVGWDTVTRNAIANSSSHAKFAQATPDQQSQQIAIASRITSVASYAGPAIGALLISLIVAGIFLATFNFGMGAHADFGQLFSVYMLSSLPQIIKSLLVILFLLLGVGRDSFFINNPIGSNTAYYLLGSSTPHALMAILTWFDVFLVWQIILLVIGCAIVAKVSRGKAAAVVVGWVAIFMLITGGLAAI